MKICTPSTFPLGWLMNRPAQIRRRGNPKSKSKNLPEYIDIISAFDIETTRISEIEQSVMWVWQWAFATMENGVEFVVIGRTWEQYTEFKRLITCWLKNKRRIITFVHNLSFEFAFLQGIESYKPDDVFAVKPRKILYASTADGVEFRCSYLHSNMSLRTYLSKMQVEHQKQSGREFDYEKRRYPWTTIEDKEIPYLVNDVAGLCEAIIAEMKADGDNLYTLPRTSTGYVRRDAKKAMREVSKSYISAQISSCEVLDLLREMFRGGNCHANRHFADRVIRAKRDKAGRWNIHGADRSSSYPDEVCNAEVPVSEFFPHPYTSAEEIAHLIHVRHRAVIARVRMWGVELKREDWGCPYLARDKCRNIVGGQFDNGRILCAEYLETSINDVDIGIIESEYSWANIEFYDVYSARYGKLPKPLIDLTIDYYRRKTNLKGVKGQEIYYTKAKNKLNSIYGFMATWVLKELIVYLKDGGPDGEHYVEEHVYKEMLKKAELAEAGEARELTVDEINEILTGIAESAFDKYARTAFCLYQWGCWITSRAREDLEEGIALAHGLRSDFLYCDTDSVYYIGEVDWTDYNNKRIAASKKSGAYATDPRGTTHYMGVMEMDHDMCEFRTGGAKKYVYRVEPNQPINVTVSGVVKLAEDGSSPSSEELETAGLRKLIRKTAGRRARGRRSKLPAGRYRLRACGSAIRAFEDGFTFVKAGGLEAVYNDTAFGLYEIDGHTINITPNVTLRPSTYTLGKAADYVRLLEMPWKKISVDNQEILL